MQDPYPFLVQPKFLLLILIPLLIKQHKVVHVRTHVLEGDPKIWDGLSLRFIYYHGKTQRYRELCFLLNLKGREISSEGDNGILGMKTFFPHMLSTNDLGINFIVLQCSHHNPYSIAQSFVRIKIVEKNHNTVVFQLQLMRGKSFGVIEFKKSIGQRL